MMTKLMAGASEYDIVSPSTSYLPVMITNLLEKLDKSKLGKTFENTDERLNLMEISKSYDRGIAIFNTIFIYGNRNYCKYK